MKKIIGILVVCIICILFTGCSSVKESVSTDGSTAMEKIIGVLGETYEEQTGVKVSYNPTGSGAGIRAVAAGNCDIGLSSRDLKEEEKEQGLKATVLAYDGITIIVNHDNPVNDIDIGMITKIFTGEITNWSQLGGNDSKIVLIGREAGSGTRNSFESITHTENKCDYRQELTSTGDIITTVSRNPDAIGYASAASVKDTVKVLTISGVAPTEAAIKDGSYAVRRPFMLITRTDTVLSEKAQKFFDYITSENTGELISLAGVAAAN